MATRTVGTGGTYATVTAAAAAASDNDTIQLVSDISEPQGSDIEGLDNIILDLGGFTVTHDSAQGDSGGAGWRFDDCKNWRVRNGACVNISGDRSRTYGAGFNLFGRCAYWLFEDLEISYYIQAAINTVSSQYWTTPYFNEGTEYVWVERCNMHHFDVNNTFNESGSVISWFQPAVVSGAVAPSWWVARRDALATVPNEPTGANRSLADLVFVVKDCILSDYLGSFNSPPDSDENGVIMDQWVPFTGTHVNYCTQRPGAWSLTENSRFYNITGHAWHNFASSDSSAPSPHVCRNNTSVKCGQRRRNTTVPNQDYDGIGSAWSSATLSGLGDTTRALVYNNVSYDSGAATSDEYGTGYSSSGNLYRDNAAFDYDDMLGPGSNWTLTDPRLDSYTDPDMFHPDTGSDVVNNGTASVLFDATGAPRSPTTPTQGALEPNQPPKIGRGTLLLL